MKQRSWIGPLLLLVVMACALLFPLTAPDAGTYSILIYTLLYATAGVGWNLFSGYSGYVSLGYASFTGIGAYTLAIICDHWQIPGDYSTFLLLPVAGLVSGVAAIPLGVVVLRTRRVAFVVATIAMMFVLQALAFNLRGFTSGSSGILLPETVWQGNVYNLPFYYVSLGLVLLASGVAWWIRTSKYGLGLLAIRDDEERARGLGIKTEGLKLSAFVLSAFFGGMVGAMFAFYGGTVFPASAFDPTINLRVTLIALMGGVGVPLGPVVGAFLVEPLRQYLSAGWLQAVLPTEAGVSGMTLFLLGSLLMVVVFFLPDGILPTLRGSLGKWSARSKAVKEQANGRDLENMSTPGEMGEPSAGAET